ncbi:MAG: transketolase [Proteobacteria bacterium]|nr:transketolase [Pseudomonadota bacterium]
MGDQETLDRLCINTIRMLAVDMVEAANSGHPGMPLGAAPMAYVLWTRFLKHNPANPAWFNRDRFILSAGHGSALLYALLHLTGYDLPLDELKNFRQWESRTPGHPEYGLTPGVEATTGPLGQGFAMGTGMALAELFLADQFNKPDFDLVDHYTYAIVSDGDLMEGVASEAASLAGTMGLSKLVYLYDDNHISIEGSTDLAFREDVRRRFEAYGWQVIRVADGNDPESIATAIENARADHEHPSLIMVRTHIGCCSPKEDTASVHGEPLGPEATRQTRENLGWPLDSAFHIPPEALDHFRQALVEGEAGEKEWLDLLAAYRREHPEEAARFDGQVKGELPTDWDADLPVFSAEEKIATRAASGKVLNALAGRLPHMIGGSADLAPSNKTLISGSGDLGLGQSGGRNIHFGVREHAMGAMVNGMALHGGVIPYGGTFFVFSDYMRPALRLAALMNVPSIFIFTHESIGVGEDGPTHQPVEHLVSLRAIPRMTVIRPADGNETAEAWKYAVQSRGPVALLLTRQKVPNLDAAKYPVADGLPRGAYVLSDCQGTPDLILIGTGSELNLAMAAAEKLSAEGRKVRVVSMPSWELFASTSEAYQASVLPPEVKARLAVEAGSSLGWRTWVGDRGNVIGLDHFGASAPGGQIMDRLGFNVDNVVARAKAVLERCK